MQVRTGDLTVDPILLIRSVATGWRLVLRWIFVGGLIAIGIALFRPKLYRATSTLLVASTESPDIARLRGLASQFGLGNLAGSSASISAEMVEHILLSDVFLLGIAESPIHGDTSVAVLADHLRVKPLAPVDDLARARRKENTLKRLREEVITVAVDRKTGAVSVAVESQSRGLTNSLVRAISDSLDSYLFRVGSTTARTEREAIEERLADQEARVSAEEEALISFLERNRDYQASPTLRATFERISRKVILQQQVLSSLAQSREDAFAREQRTRPSVTTIIAPVDPELPQPRRRILILVACLAIGGLVGALHAALAPAFSQLAKRHQHDLDLLYRDIAGIPVIGSILRPVLRAFQQP